MSDVLLPHKLLCRRAADGVRVRTSLPHAQLETSFTNKTSTRASKELLCTPVVDSSQKTREHMSTASDPRRRGSSRRHRASCRQATCFDQRRPAASAPPEFHHITSTRERPPCSLATWCAGTFGSTRPCGTRTARTARTACAAHTACAVGVADAQVQQAQHAPGRQECLGHALERLRHANHSWWPGQLLARGGPPPSTPLSPRLPPPLLSAAFAPLPCCHEAGRSVRHALELQTGPSAWFKQSGSRRCFSPVVVATCSAYATAARPTTSG